MRWCYQQYITVDDQTYSKESEGPWGRQFVSPPFTDSMKNLIDDYIRLHLWPWPCALYLAIDIGHVTGHRCDLSAQAPLHACPSRNPHQKKIMIALPLAHLTVLSILDLDLSITSVLITSA